MGVSRRRQLPDLWPALAAPEVTRAGRRLTGAQIALLDAIKESKSGVERFGSGGEWQSAKALKRRGLADVMWIGMRWWRIRITDAGRAALASRNGGDGE